MTQVLLFFHLLSKFQGFVFQFGHSKKGHSYYKELFHNYSTSLLYENKCRVFQEWCEKSVYSLTECNSRVTIRSNPAFVAQNPSLWLTPLELGAWVRGCLLSSEEFISIYIEMKKTFKRSTNACYVEVPVEIGTSGLPQYYRVFSNKMDVSFF